MLVCQDLRERNGDFFTPPMWASKGIEYLTKALGEDWQDNYYVWDCCCGTGNLCVDLKRQDRLFLSTLEKAHIKIMQEENINPDATTFQFDFLNDDWKPVKEGGKIPDKLFKIIKETPEKLVIYINPPYAEATSKKTISKSEKHKGRTAITKLKNEVAKNWGGGCSNELFIQFYYRIYKEITGCVLGCFSTLKNIQAPNCCSFRKYFKAQWGGYIVPANTFDNVTGSFPISFQIWKTNNKTQDFPNELYIDVFNDKEEWIGVKKCITYDELQMIIYWFSRNKNIKSKKFCDVLRTSGGNAFQDNNYICLLKNDKNNPHIIKNTELFSTLIYLSIRTSINATWLNDRDQFTAPFEKKNEVEFGEKANEKHYLYEDDQDFINNCIIFAIFTKNYTDWCLFDNSELRIKEDRDLEVWNLLKKELKKKKLTKEAQDVYDCALKICKFYHEKKCGKNYIVNDKTITDYNYKANASWNDVLNGIKGMKPDKNGKMSRNTSCEAYPDADILLKTLASVLKILAKEIEAGVYKYGFLRN